MVEVQMKKLVIKKVCTYVSFSMINHCEFV